MAEANTGNANTDTLVEVEQLTRLYGRLRAVDNVSFTLRKGQVLGFLGPNGAGKSTTMQMLCGALAPSSGRIVINGIDLLEQPLAAKRAIGFLPEQPPLYNDMSTREYLQYCARLRGISSNAQVGAIDNAMQRCGLTDVSRRLIGNLSKGYQQRVGIAQAIIHTPAVVVLDEPTVGLDPIQIREIRQLIRELGRDHGVILSTHILPEVQMTCDHVQIIHRGRLVFNDSLAALNSQAQAGSLVAGFRRAPDVDALAAIDGVEAVQSMADNRFRILFGAGQSPAEAIVAAAVSGDWGLRELTPDARSLEQIFVELTSSEAIDTTHQEQAA